MDVEQTSASDDVLHRSQVTPMLGGLAVDDADIGHFARCEAAVVFVVLPNRCCLRSAEDAA